MKKRQRAFFGFAVILITAIFTLAGCDNGTTPNNNNGNGNSNPLITGKFASQTGIGDAVFYADYTSNARSVSRAVAGMSATEKELTGKIEDGDIVFNLKGVYNNTDNKFFLSAGSSILVYQIAGTLSNGNLSSTKAAVKVKSNDDWVVHEVAVTTTSDTKIDTAASAEQEAGIPSAWFGNWETEENDSIIITAFQWINPKFPDNPAGLVDLITEVQGEKYSAIFQAVDWVPPAPVPEGQEPEQGYYASVYTRVTAEAQGADILVKIYGASESEDYAETRDHDISGDTVGIQTWILSRPN